MLKIDENFMKTQISFQEKVFNNVLKNIKKDEKDNMENDMENDMKDDINNPIIKNIKNLLYSITKGNDGRNKDKLNNNKLEGGSDCQIKDSKFINYNVNNPNLLLDSKFNPLDRSTEFLNLKIFMKRLNEINKINSGKVKDNIISSKIKNTKNIGSYDNYNDLYSSNRYSRFSFDVETMDYVHSDTKSNDKKYNYYDTINYLLLDLIIYFASKNDINISNVMYLNMNYNIDAENQFNLNYLEDRQKKLFLDSCSENISKLLSSRNFQKLRNDAILMQNNYSALDEFQKKSKYIELINLTKNFINNNKGNLEEINEKKNHFLLVLGCFKNLCAEEIGKIFNEYLYNRFNDLINIINSKYVQITTDNIERFSNFLNKYYYRLFREKNLSKEYYLAIKQIINSSVEICKENQKKQKSEYSFDDKPISEENYNQKIIGSINNLLKKNKPFLIPINIIIHTSNEKFPISILQSVILCKPNENPILYIINGCKQFEIQDGSTTKNIYINFYEKNLKNKLTEIIKEMFRKYKNILETQGLFKTLGGDRNMDIFNNLEVYGMNEIYRKKNEKITGIIYTEKNYIFDVLVRINEYCIRNNYNLPLRYKNEINFILNYSVSLDNFYKLFLQISNLDNDKLSSYIRNSLKTIREDYYILFKKLEKLQKCLNENKYNLNDIIKYLDKMIFNKQTNYDYEIYKLYLKMIKKYTNSYMKELSNDYPKFKYRLPLTYLLTSQLQFEIDIKKNKEIRSVQKYVDGCDFTKTKMS